MFGWWDFDTASNTMTNRLTAQCVCFHGAFESYARWRKFFNPDPPQNSKWWRFEYSDDEIRFPILAQLVRHQYPDFSDKFHWLVDYNKSARVWANENNSDDLYPPYGTWIRVDHCISDALMFWPNFPPGSVKGGRANFESCGGWANAKWQRALSKRINGPTRSFYEIDRVVKNGMSSKWAERPLQRPTLEPLDLEPPMPWEFHDAPKAKAGATISGLFRDDKNSRLTLSPDAPLSGFERDIPNVRRTDGSAVLFPNSIKTAFHRSEDYNPVVDLTYADDELVLFSRGNRDGNWGEFDFHNIIASGVRDEAIPHSEAFEYFAEYEFSSEPTVFPNVSQWRRLSSAILDARMAWSGSSLCLLDNPDKMTEREKWLVQGIETDRLGVLLTNPKYLRIKGTYSAGYFYPHAEVQIGLSA